MKIEHKNELLEFACAVCDERRKEMHPESIGCAWRCLDGEYCDWIKRALKTMQHPEANA